MKRFWQSWGCLAPTSVYDIWPSCPNCHGLIPPGSNFCDRCGHALFGRMAWPHCPHCKSEFKIGTRRCQSCLCPLPSPAELHPYDAGAVIGSK